MLISKVPYNVWTSESVFKMIFEAYFVFFSSPPPTFPPRHLLTFRYSLMHQLFCKSRDSPVCSATDYGLDDRMIGVRITAGAGNFSVRHRVQTGSGAHPALYPMCTGGSFPGDKATRACSWPPTTIQYRGPRVRGAIPQLPNTSSWRGA
jgi:hypothetical protein